MDTFLILILVIVSIDFLFGMFLDILNLNYKTNAPVPLALKAHYNSEQYEKSLRYKRSQIKFGFLSQGSSFIILLLVLGFGGFGFLDKQVGLYSQDPIIQSMLFFGCLYVVSDILGIPFQWYSTFVLEEQYGFNKTNIKTFWMDKIKGYGVAFVLGGLLLGTLMVLINELGTNFWIYFWGVAVGFILFFNLFYTALILPLFNRLVPLEDGELKDKITAYSKKIDFPITNIFVMDGSKRSNKANAFFSGLGKKKKIVLYDTLIANHSTEELVAVLAHEVGHYKEKHIIKSLVLSALQIGGMLYLASLLLFNENLSMALGGTGSKVHLNLLAYGMLFTPISHAIGTLMNILSRKNEYEADNYAKKTYGGAPLSEALKKLSVDNLSNLYPHPFYVYMHYSHPPLLKRLHNLEQ